MPARNINFPRIVDYEKRELSSSSSSSPRADKSKPRSSGMKVLCSHTEPVSSLKILEAKGHRSRVLPATTVTLAAQLAYRVCHISSLVLNFNAPPPPTILASIHDRQGYQSFVKNTQPLWFLLTQATCGSTAAIVERFEHARSSGSLESWRMRTGHAALQLLSLEA